jgi:PIN domain nuclease of toxin-antitoxin system
MSGCYIWIFPYREGHRRRWSRSTWSESSAVAAWELRLNAPAGDLQLDEWERLFYEKGELDAYLRPLEIEWLQGEEAETIRKLYFPLR